MPLLLPEFLDARLAVAVLARITVAVAIGLMPLFPAVPLRVGAALAVACSLAAVPSAAAAVRATGVVAAPLPLVILGEAMVGLALGTGVAAVAAAAAWAGTVLGTMSGLSWADEFDPAGDPEAAGAARLARWLGLAGFLVAGGHLAVIAGLIDSLRLLPPGRAAAGDAWGAVLAAALPGAACTLAVSLAAPAAVAVLACHVSAAICSRAIRFAPGPGLVQALAALALLAALTLSVETWLGGFGRVARDDVARRLADVGGGSTH